MFHREQQDHIALVHHIRWRAVPGLLWWHTPQGAHYANERQGALMKAMGVRPGVSDLMFLYRNQFYALELKTLKRSRTHAEQRQFIEDVRMQGGRASVAKGLDEALRILEAWKLIKGETAVQLDLIDFIETRCRDSIAKTKKGLKFAAK